MNDIIFLKEKINNSNFTDKEELLNKLNNIENNLKNKKYGLVWEDKLENVKEDLKDKFIYLIEETDKRIIENEGGTENLLIEGDNLESLMALQYTHKGKVDVIYIDPPYNTGNKDFIYNDKYVDENNAWRHSCWLSFMNKRLRLAKDLLSDNGIIFISIGDNELAQLKLLCDDIFGEDNSLPLFSRVTKKTSNNGNYFSPCVDYILSYTKTFNGAPKFTIGLNNEQIKRYSKKDDYFLERGYYQEIGLYQSALKHGGSRYPILCPDGTFVITPEGKPWRWNESTFLKNKLENRVVFKKTTTSPLINFETGRKAEWNVYTKSYLNDRLLDGITPKNFSDDFHNNKGTKLLKEMRIDFDFSKPVELLKFLISFHSKDAVVLDFFAGSGTTGHAILELNKEDGGNRQFILCTNNENNICQDITYQRLNKVINGYITPKNEEISGIYSNLRYYKTNKLEKTNNNEFDQFNLLNKTLELIQIKENTFNILKSDTCYSLLGSSDKIVGLYSFGFINPIEIENMLDELIESDKLNKIAYVPVEDISEIYDYIDDKYIGLVKFEKMPKELIEIYNKLNRN